jgi:AAA ATPase domain
MDGRSRELAGPAGLRGRANECALLDALVAAIRRGDSRSLVLHGEAGIGKTALLDYLIASASDLTIVQAVGVESEMQLDFASLHQLCAPLLDRLPELPDPQRRAVEIRRRLLRWLARRRTATTTPSLDQPDRLAERVRIGCRASRSREHPRLRSA